MPSPTPVLGRREASRVIAARGFDAPASAIGTGRHVGIELEWLTVDADEPTRPAAPAAVAAAATSAAGLLPNASRLTFEPGGQVELSALPLPLGRACDALAEDSEVLGNALADAGIALVSLGLEPGVQRDRVLRTPRYDAMERYFDSCGPAGRTMMRSTAALQVNLDLGSGREIASRWHTAHAIGPVLAAAFANSPIGPDGPTGFRSTRLAVWSTVDDARTAPVDDGAGCRDAWSQYALDAPVMLVRTSADDYEPLVSPLAFGEWIARGHELGWPTIADLDYHLTTLFPPVRPRGWLELRMIDAVPSPWWRVATAVSAVIVEDSAVATSLCEHLEPVRGRWDVAARCGLSDPALAEAARACFTAALAAFPRFGVDQTTRAATEEYLERYVSVGRCPADDRLDDWHAGRPPFPRAENRVRDGAWT